MRFEPLDDDPRDGLTVLSSDATQLGALMPLSDDSFLVDVGGHPALPVPTGPGWQLAIRSEVGAEAGKHILFRPTAGGPDPLPELTPEVAAWTKLAMLAARGAATVNRG